MNENSVIIIRNNLKNIIHFDVIDPKFFDGLYTNNNFNNKNEIAIEVISWFPSVIINLNESLHNLCYPRGLFEQSLSMIEAL